MTDRRIEFLKKLSSLMGEYNAEISVQCELGGYFDTLTIHVDSKLCELGELEYWGDEQIQDINRDTANFVANNLK